MNHTINMSPPYYEAVVSGDLTFDVRDNELLGLQKGDVVHFLEVDDKRRGLGFGRPTGRSTTVVITFVTNLAQVDGNVVFCFRKE